MHKEITERFIRYAKKETRSDEQVKQSQQRHLKQPFKGT